MANETGAQQQPKLVGIREDFFTTPLSPSEQVRLRGTRCRSCGEVFVGKRLACENCASEDMEDTVLSRRGKLYTYTIIRHRPPGDYKGPDDPFVPFALGLIELPDGLRLQSKLTDCEFDDLKIGMEMELEVDKLYTDEDGTEVMEFKFKPA